jgi:hypothetical protein
LIQLFLQQSKMDAERLLRQIQEELEDDDDEIAAMLLLQQMSQTSAIILDAERQHGGSLPGRSRNVERDRMEGHERIFRDYFAPDPVYNETLFRRRYRMRRGLFLKIVEAVKNQDSYFTQRRDARGLLGISTIQKITSAVRMLAYGVAADATDEYCRIGESTAKESMKRFTRAICEVFESFYLRQPSKDDILKQMSINRERGFPGMFGSIDYMHYDWKNCPVAWQGQYNDKDKNRSIILEAVADQSLHIWHAFFGLPGSNNDLNVLDRSPLVRNLLASPAEGISFMVNNTQYPRYYLLADGIYPKWSIFVQTIHNPQGKKRQHFATVQEAVRKDVERAFGVLQARFAIISSPSRLWDMADIDDILMACVILHNMIIEDEAGKNLELILNSVPSVPLTRKITPMEYLFGSQEIEDSPAHFSLRNDIIEHLWQVKGE